MLLYGEPGVGKTCVLRAVRHCLPRAGFRLTYCHLQILLNYEWDSRALLSLILVGTPELLDRLELRKNRALFSRIHRRLAIGPMTCDDTAEYIRMPWRDRACARSTASRLTPFANRRAGRRSWSNVRPWNGSPAISRPPGSEVSAPAADHAVGVLFAGSWPSCRDARRARSAMAISAATPSAHAPRWPSTRLSCVPSVSLSGNRHLCTTATPGSETIHLPRGFPHGPDRRAPREQPLHHEGRGPVGHPGDEARRSPEGQE